MLGFFCVVPDVMWCVVLRSEFLVVSGVCVVLVLWDVLFLFGRCVIDVLFNVLSVCSCCWC